MQSKKNLIVLISSLFFLLGICYLFFLLVLPKILNSNFLIKKYENIIFKKTGYETILEDFKYKSNRNLTFEISVKRVLVLNPKSKKMVLNTDDTLYYSKILSFKPKKIKLRKIFIDCRSFEKTKAQKQTKINLDLLSKIETDEIFVKIDNNSTLKINNIKPKKIKRKLYYTLIGEFKNKSLVKDSVVFGKTGYIVHNGKKWEFENYSAELGQSKLFFNGNDKKLQIKGNNLPLDEIKAYYIYFYKLSHNNKKNFIENFHDLSGKLTVNLLFKKGIPEGNCVVKDMTSNLFNYKIPVEIPKVIFKFKNNNIKAKTNGYVDKNIAPTTFLATGLFTKDFTVLGDVKTTVDNSFPKKFYPDIKIDGKANLVVKYKTQKGITNVDYKLQLEKNNDITFQEYKLGSGKRKRLIEAFTRKEGNSIILKKYLYSFYNKNDKKIPVFSGDGKFEEINGHYKPSFLTIKTLKNIPISAVKFITKDYVEGGTFSSDLKFDFLSKKLSGNFEMNDVHHKDFLHLKNIHLDILEDVIVLNTYGTFFDSPINMNVIIDNEFRDDILVHDINIHLNKFLVKREKYTHLPATYKNINKEKLRKHNYNIEIETGKIVVDEIIHPKFYLHDVEILGDLRDDVVNFLTKPTQYSKGTLISVGSYNIAEHSSDIEFCASDIDSNEVVTKIFNLPNQVNGLASATLHLKTKNKLNDVKADASFMIENGSLPKIGSTEFIFKKTKKMEKFKFINFEKIKFSLSKITNIDFSSKKTPSVAHIDGNFSLDNEQMKNANIYFTSDFVSMFIEGNYNIDTQYADLTIWGRHNKTAEKKIRILKLPFTFLYRLIFRPEHTKDLYTNKINKIPPIKLKLGDVESIFRVLLEGNINSDNFKVNMNDLK